MYHLQGVCQFGDSCAFAHSCDELQGAPDLRKTRLCKSFVDGVCQDPDCTFAHTEEELRSTDMFYKKTLCMWHEKNACRNGDQCRFAHGVAELRTRAPHNNTERGKGGALPAPPKPAGVQPQRRNEKPLTGKGGRSGNGEAEGEPSGPAAYSGPPILDDYLSQAQLMGGAPGLAPSVASREEPMFVKTLPATISTAGFMQQPLPPPPLPGARTSSQVAQSMMIADQLYHCGQQLEQLRAVQTHLHRASNKGYYSTAGGGNGNEPKDEAGLAQLSQNISMLSEQLSRFESQMQRPPELEDPGLVMARQALGVRTPTVAGAASPYPWNALLQEQPYFA
jgi:hypothetical protein